MSSNQFILVLLAITPFLISSVTAQSKEFDQPCNVDADCLANSFLYCSNDKKCACVNPGVDLTHDPATKKCLIPFGTTCHLQSEPGEPTCTSGSTCTESDWTDPAKGHCTCNIGFQGIEKLCLPRLPQDGTCQLQSDSIPTVRQCLELSECDRHSLKCNCKNGLVFDRQYQECTLKTGANCHIDPVVGKEATCSSNALCENKPWLPIPAQGQCTCKTGFVNIPTEERCLKQIVAIGEYCEADKPPTHHSCIQYAACNENSNQCNCWSSFETVNNDNNVCVLKGTGLAEEPCFLDEPKCTENSECQKLSKKTNPFAVDKEEDVIGLCKCAEGFVTTGDNRCQIRAQDNAGVSFGPLILVMGVLQGMLLMY